jgi:putative heme-binding domain-containing protein
MIRSIGGVCLFVCAVHFLYVCPSSLAAEAPQRDIGNRSAAFGLDKRTYWTTSNFRGRPEPPPPFRAQRIYPTLGFDKPTVLTSAPGTKRLFVAEHSGKVYSIPGDPQSSQADLFLDASELVAQLNKKNVFNEPVAFEALYGLTFDPDFVKNRYCYVCYVVRRVQNSKNQLPDGTRVVRLTVSDNDPPKCDPASEKPIISWLQGGHNGGCLKFGLDGCLYISAGDGGFAFPPDGLNSGQDVTNLMSTIMRIDVRHEEKGRAYTIPADNPFVSLPKARGEIWAYGVRNPWKMSFDRQTGDLWAGDVGWELWELVYRVRRGDNFGWSLVEGRQPVHSERQRGPTPIVPPTIEIPHTEGASVTGGYVYRGKKFPELIGQYIFGDWETRRIWGVPVDGEKLGERREIVEATVRIVDFAEDNDGELYLLDYDDGSIHALARNDVKATNESFPRKLTDTGLFTSVAEHRVAPGVMPFSINCEQWVDHATSERFLGVPGTDPIRIRSKAKVITGSMFSRQMDFPKDSVVMKTLSLELTAGDPASRRRIETQVLHFDGREWFGYSYEWNDEQTDATLVAATGKSRTLYVADPQSPGGKRTQTWWYPSRMECIRCHNPWSEYTLAFNIPQLNRSHDFGSASDNQIRTYRHIGLLEDIVEKPDPLDPYLKIEPPKAEDKLPRLANPYNASDEIDARARAYLHVNCAHCHRFNGGGSSYVYLQHDLPLASTKAVGARPTQGTFGIHDAQILAPGDPYRSVLYFRLAKLGPGHMPHIGAKIIDQQGLAVIHDWIRQLPTRLDDSNKLEQLIALDEPALLATEQEEAQRARWLIARGYAKRQKRETPNDAELEQAGKQAANEAAKRAQQRTADRAKLIDELLSTPSRALLLVDAMRAKRLPESIQRLVVEASVSRTDLAIRDVLEPFVPEDQRAKRLGEAVQPAEILKLSGDVERGRQLFHEATTVQCRNCHRIRGQGTELGPDLSEIGKKHDRAKLLESILTPSLNIEPKYLAWLAETKSGNVYAGLMVKRDDKEVILKDAQNKQHVIPASDIEGLFPQRKSFMPDLLVRDFTAQQLADLLAYLASLK